MLASSIDFGAAPLFGLVANPGATGRAHGAADDRARRTADRAAHHGAGGDTTERTGAGSGLVIASLGGLTRDGTADRADGAADDRTGRPSDGGSDGRSTERTDASADGLATGLFVIGGRPSIHRPIQALTVEVRVERIGVPVDTCGVVRSIHPARLLGLVWGP
jgi:hypothetical protein